MSSSDDTQHPAVLDFTRLWLIADPAPKTCPRKTTDLATRDALVRDSQMLSPAQTARNVDVQL